jgi:hypothetical protein
MVKSDRFPRLPSVSPVLAEKSAFRLTGEAGTPCSRLNLAL